MFPTTSETVLVVAKAPVPGRVKTRLQSRVTPTQAAEIAGASLRDTIRAARGSRATRRVLAVDGDADAWSVEGFAVVDQGDGDLADRLATAWSTVQGPCVQIAMDTPQVSSADLDDALDRLAAPGCDAVLGPATDGGWWCLGLHRPQPGVFDGIAMSRRDTGARQLARLRSMGLRVDLLATLTDLDRPEDLDRIASGHPHLEVAAAARSLEMRPG